MSDEESVCVCGFEAKNSRGLSAHQRACDEYQENEEDEQQEVAACDYSDFEKEVLNRDGGACVNCGTEDTLVVHKVHSERPDDKLSNFKTLCKECDAELKDYDARTKRTLMRD